MELKQVLIAGNSVRVEDISAPQVDSKNILVKVHYSCISIGTEMASISLTSDSLFKTALKHPEKIQDALQMLHDHGLNKTIKRITDRSSKFHATGYSAAGEIIAIGKDVKSSFFVGDRVACVGSGIANHAEYINVPINLATPIPKNVSMQHGATVALGTIALHGVRRVEPQLGETIIVIGLGTLGQLTAQMLKMNGCYVIGIDLEQSRVDIAITAGIDYGLNPNKVDLPVEISRITNGIGADRVIITAATQDHNLINQAMKLCRKKGRIVLVGDVGLNLKREDFYQKEIDLFMSTSYGPGRYDLSYEQEGSDYPLPYVRWTENRNMAAYLRMLESKQVNLEIIKPEVFPVDQAPQAYKKLAEPKLKPLLALLHFPISQEKPSRKILLNDNLKRAGAIQVAIAGAGAFAQSTLLPNLAKLRNQYQIRAIMGRTGVKIKPLANTYQSSYVTTDYSNLLEDPLIDLIVISTRHHLHGSMVLEALNAGKHVFVEKPLTIFQEELDAIENFFEHASIKPILMTGFNRRFSKAIALIKNELFNRDSPLIINYRMNAGFLPDDHWVHGPEGGGRNIGEACHIYDLFNFLVGDSPISMYAKSIGRHVKLGGPQDNFIATLNYPDGSLCSLTYTSHGTNLYPKEKMELFVNGKVIVLDDYHNLTTYGGKNPAWKGLVDKGHFEELKNLNNCIRDSQKWPIPLHDQLNASRISLTIENFLK